MKTSDELAAFALALGAEAVGKLSQRENELLSSLTPPPVSTHLPTKIATRIQAGEDPLGEAFCAIRSAKVRRGVGAVYTPQKVVRAMVGRAKHLGTPDRIIDPGAGSGRFLVEAGRRFPRGQITGANHIWIAAKRIALPPSVLFPSVTKASDLTGSSWELTDSGILRQVIDIPKDLDVLSGSDRRLVDAFLRFAEAEGARESYTARHRKAWWSVGLRSPAPILASYMSRRPPAFVLNSVQARHINVAHGLYPRDPYPDSILLTLVHYLRTSVKLKDGRMYAGGLVKFEPKEMERIAVPNLSLLEEMTRCSPLTKASNTI